MRVAIVGGGMAGLGTALALTRAGHEIVILERDATPMPGDPDTAFAHWERRGAPQVRHSHAFLARLRNLLRERAPDVLDGLLAAGATEWPFCDNLPETLTDRLPRPGDDELVALACRRTTFEWVLLRTVLEERSVEVSGGVSAVGLVSDVGGAGRLRRVVGVSVRDADGRVGEIGADLVIDARGPRSSSDSWLRSIGAPASPEELHESGIVYLSRFYRLRDTAEAPPVAGPIGGDLGYVKYAVFVGDNRTFSVTFAVDVHDDRLRKALMRAAPFEAGAAALVATAPWRSTGVSEPITGVHVMAGLRNRYRPFVVGDDPLALGFVPVGDAAVCTNPLYGRGCALALVHAYGLADALESKGDDLAAFAREYAAFTERELVPWYRAAVMQDEQAREFARVPSGERDPDARGGGAEDPRAFMQSVFRDGLLPAVRTSPVVFRAFLRWFNLLATPDALMADPSVVADVMVAYNDRDNRPPQPALGPDRAGFEVALGT